MLVKYGSFEVVRDVKEKSIETLLVKHEAYSEESIFGLGIRQSNTKSWFE